MEKYFYIKTFGCQMNEYDSDKIADILSQNGGYIKTDKPENADVIVINTCSIREKAEEKIFSALGVFRKLKLKKTELIIGVAGCVASQEGANILIRAPYIDLIFGPQTIHRILELIDARKETKKPQIDLSFPTIEKFDFLPQTKTTSASAFVSIMEGCSKYCSYCVVPYTRGEEVSRDVSGILKEINHLASQGVKEVNLLGQNVNAYCGVLSDGEAVDFAFLLKAIHNIDGIERIRYTTSHPKEMTQRIIECYAELPKLMPHLHLPVQSGSDRILAQMKRGYTVLEYKSIIKKLRKIRKNMSMSSDFIVGFPGETEEDFKKTIDLINDIGYDNSYSFIFSPRPGTPAASLPDITPMGIKLERLRLLQTTIDAFSKSISESMVETTQAVLVEGQSKRHNELTGRTENNKTVNFAGDISLINTIVNLKIINTTSYSLIAQLI